MWRESGETSLFRDMGAALGAIRRMMRYLRPYRLRLVLYVVLTCAMSAPALIAPRLLQAIIDVAYPARDFPLLWWLCGGLFLVSIAGSLLSAAVTYLSTYISNMLRFRLTATVFRSVDRLPLRVIEEQQRGAFLERTLRDVLVVAQGLPAIVSRGGTIVFTLVVALAIILTTNVWLCLLVLAIVPGNYLITLFLSRELRKLALRERRVNEEVTSFTEESLDGAIIARVFGFGRLRRRQLGMHLRNLTGLAFATWRVTTLWGQLGTVMGATWVTLLLGLCWYVVFNGWLAIGEAVALGLYIQLLFQPFQQLADVYALLMSTSVSAERLGTVMREVEAACALERRPALPRPPSCIELKNLSFSYGEGGKSALSGINLRLEENSTVAIVGPNGSGKSTLLRILAGLDDRYTGQVMLDGQDLKTYAPRSYLAHVSLVPQRTTFFRDSVRNNLMPLDTNGIDRVKDSVNALGMHALIDALPNGYDTPVGQGGQVFSAGQAQILGVIRALVKPCAVLLLDEITSNVDAENEARLLKGILGAPRKGRITVVVTHSARVLAEPLIDRVIVLNEGQIVSDGPPASLAPEWPALLPSGA